jgi:hypothetical protein
LAQVAREFQLRFDILQRFFTLFLQIEQTAMSRSEGPQLKMDLRASKRQSVTEADRGLQWPGIPGPLLVAAT